MKKKNFVIAEVMVFFAVTAGAVFLWNIYELSGKSTISILFGAVNSSVWEKAKGLSICWLLFGLTELMCVKPSFRCFVASKALGLCVSLILFIFLDSLFTGNLFFDILILTVSVAAGCICTYILSVSEVNLRSFFAPACFLLMLIFMMTFSFTAFAPKLGIFRDPYTGCYGIISPSFDMGAVALGR